MNTPLRIWITGASSGIGHACARTLANAGHRVWASARSLDPLDALANESVHFPGELIAYPVDVTVPNEVSACANAMVDAWGGIDVVIPNAGMGLFNLLHAPLTEWRTMVDVNISGVLSTLHAALLIVVEPGYVINIDLSQHDKSSQQRCLLRHQACSVGDF